MSQGKREDMPVGSLLSWGTFLGYGEPPTVVGHRAACRATSHLHHREPGGNLGRQGVRRALIWHLDHPLGTLI